MGLGAGCAGDHEPQADLGRCRWAERSLICGYPRGIIQVITCHNWVITHNHINHFNNFQYSKPWWLLGIFPDEYRHAAGDRLIFWGRWQPLKLSAANPKMFAAWYSEIAHCLNAVWDSGKFGMSQCPMIGLYNICILYVYILFIYHIWMNLWWPCSLWRHWNDDWYGKSSQMASLLQLLSGLLFYDSTRSYP